MLFTSRDYRIAALSNLWFDRYDLTVTLPQLSNIEWLASNLQLWPIYDHNIHILKIHFKTTITLLCLV